MRLINIIFAVTLFLGVNNQTISNDYTSLKTSAYDDISATIQLQVFWNDVIIDDTDSEDHFSKIIWLEILHKKCYRTLNKAFINNKTKSNLSCITLEYPLIDLPPPPQNNDILK